MPFTLRKPAAIAMLMLLSSLGLAACGESSSEKARKQVCAASSEISKQIAKVKALPINSSFPAEASASVQAIDKSLKEVRSAAPKLEGARKEEVEAGTKAFEAELAAITASTAAAVVKSGNAEAALKAAAPQIEAAVSQLAADYKKAFAALNCS